MAKIIVEDYYIETEGDVSPVVSFEDYEEGRNVVIEIIGFLPDGNVCPRDRINEMVEYKEEWVDALVNKHVEHYKKEYGDEWLQFSDKNLKVAVLHMSTRPKEVGILAAFYNPVIGHGSYKFKEKTIRQVIEK